MPSLARPVQLRCNHLTNPLGQHDPSPALSWRISSDGHRGARQSAYRIQVSTRRNGPADLWDSKWVKSDATHGIPYSGQPLTSRQRAWWRVEVQDETGQSAASAPAYWEAGLLHPDEWQGEWIGSALAGGPDSTVPSPYLRTIFNVSKKVTRARLCVTALGLYEFQFNGQRIGRDEFTPGWTDYAKRVQYQVYDITPHLRSGANAAGAILGDGWYCGRVGWRTRGYYGDRPKLLAQIVITYRDGSEQTVVTDHAWKTSSGAIVENDIMHGETHDARRELNGWSQADYDDRTWLPVATFPQPNIEISPTIGTTVQATQEIKPVSEPRKIAVWPDPVWIFDLGQNLAGRIRLRVKGPAGQTLRLRYAEVVNADGSLYTENLRAARVTDYYILRGDPAGEIWEPKFTFHGFRYVEVSGHPETLTAEAITGIVLHNDIPRTGDFTSSATSTGGSGATSLKCRPIARNAMSAWVGWAMPRSLFARLRGTAMSPVSLPSGSETSPMPNNPMAPCRPSFPISMGCHPMAVPPGPMRRSFARGRSFYVMATRHCSRGILPPWKNLWATWRNIPPP